MLAVAIAGVALGFIVKCENRRQLVSMIEATGGECHYIAEATGDLPKAVLFGIVPVSYVCDIDKVCMYNSSSSLDAILPRLCEFRALRELQLNNVRVSNEHLAFVAEIRSLRSLNVSRNPQLTDGGMVYVARINALVELRLRETGIGDAGVKHLSVLRNLEYLHLAKTYISDAAIAHLSSMRNIKSLYLFDTNVGNEGMQGLVNMQSLRELYLNGTMIDDAGVKTLSQFKQLEVLALNETAVSDDGLEQLLEMKYLRWLNLQNTKIGDAGVKHLLMLKSLKEVDLRETQVSADGLQRLVDSLPACAVEPRPDSIQ
jgi:Leucine-rich repeat (LRR) protein